MRTLISRLAAVAVVVGGVTALQAQRGAENRPLVAPGSVYTMSNAASGNEILEFDRLADGRLVPAERVRSGGNGTGGGLGNQGGLALTRNERWLLAVNAGSDSVSVFEVRRRGLVLTNTVRTGMRPVSVTEHRGVVYVLNAGSDSISGYRLDRHGRLWPLGQSTRLLSTTGTGPAQIAFSPDGDFLVVTEKATDRIVTFEVDRHGLAGEGRVRASNGGTPFGFAFGKRDQMFVSEAFGGAPNLSATSSYSSTATASSRQSPPASARTRPPTAGSWSRRTAGLPT